MRILHINEGYGGGSLEVTNYICNELAARGHEVVLAYSIRPETPDNFRELVSSQVRLVETPLRRELNPRQDWQGLLFVRRLLAEVKPDILHLHCAKAGFLGRIAALGTGVRAVFYSPHGYPFCQHSLSPGKRRAYRALEQVAALLPATTICCSTDEQDVARSLTRRSVVVENAVDLAAIDALLARTSKKAPEPLTIATLSRLSVVKRPGLFAEVAAEVERRASRPVRFLWIGGGDASLMPANALVEVTGWIPRQVALAKLATDAHVYLQTSESEGQPMGVIEALALGLPCVVTDVTGNRSTVRHDVTGFLSNSTAHELADKVLTLVENANLRAEMSQAARQEARSRFSVERAVDELEALYVSPAAAHFASRPSAV